MSGWRVFGKLALPSRGLIFLWVLAAVLVVISTMELILFLRSARHSGK